MSTLPATGQNFRQEWTCNTKTRRSSGGGDRAKRSYRSRIRITNSVTLNQS